MPLSDNVHGAVNFVRHDTPHPRELKARHQKLFANRENRQENRDSVENEQQQTEQQQHQHQFSQELHNEQQHQQHTMAQYESNVDQNGEDEGENSSAASVIIKNDDEIQQEQEEVGGSGYHHNQAFEDNVDFAQQVPLKVVTKEERVITNKIRKVCLSESIEEIGGRSGEDEQVHEKLRHVGFDNAGEEADGGEDQQEKLNTRLHRRDTPHHLKNKRVTQNKDEKEKVNTILSSDTQTYGRNMQPQRAAKPNIQLVQLLLHMKRTSAGLGLSIAGGIGSQPYKGDDEGIFVSRITEGGPAESAGLRVGDKMLAVNGVDFGAIPHHDAVGELKNAGNEFNILIEREMPFNSATAAEAAAAASKVPPVPPVRTSMISKSSSSAVGESPVEEIVKPNLAAPISHYNNLPINPSLPTETNRSSSKLLNRLSSGEISRPIIHTTLIRSEQGGLGFSVAGGRGGPAYKDEDGDEYEGDEGVYISSILEGGPASIDGKLLVGDKILSINGINVDGLSYDEVIAKLTGPERFVRVVIERESGHNDDEFGSNRFGNQFSYSSSSYMANRPSYTGSYKRPLLGSVSSLSGAGDGFGGPGGTISTPTTPSFAHTNRPMSSIFSAKLPGLRSEPMGTNSYSTTATVTTTTANGGNSNTTYLTSSASAPMPNGLAAAAGNNNTAIVNSSSSKLRNDFFSNEVGMFSFIVVYINLFKTKCHHFLIDGKHLVKTNNNTEMINATTNHQTNQDNNSLMAHFPTAPTDLGVFTEQVTKTTFTENTVTRVTNNTLSLPLIEEVSGQFFQILEII